MTSIPLGATLTHRMSEVIAIRRRQFLDSDSYVTRLSPDDRESLGGRFILQ